LHKVHAGQTSHGAVEQRFGDRRSAVH
jgi:hypothetical protein